MTTNQRGLIVANETAHVIISAHAHKAYSVTSWQNGKSPKTQDTLYSALKARNLYAESVFDAAHGFRYLLFVYADREGRKACFDFLTGANKCR